MTPKPVRYRAARPICRGSDNRPMARMSPHIRAGADETSKERVEITRPRKRGRPERSPAAQGGQYDCSQENPCGVKGAAKLRRLKDAPKGAVGRIGIPEHGKPGTHSSDAGDEAAARKGRVIPVAERLVRVRAAPRPLIPPVTGGVGTGASRV